MTLFTVDTPRYTWAHSVFKAHQLESQQAFESSELAQVEGEGGHRASCSSQNTFNYFKKLYLGKISLEKVWLFNY